MDNFLNPFSIQQAIRLLSEEPDGSTVNIQARMKAKNTLLLAAEMFEEMAVMNKNDSACGFLLNNARKFRVVVASA